MCNFYFNRLPRVWNCLPPIDLHQSLSTIKYMYTITYIWNYSRNILTPVILVHTTSAVLALIAIAPATPATLSQSHNDCNIVIV